MSVRIEKSVRQMYHEVSLFRIDDEMGISKYLDELTENELIAFVESIRKGYPGVNLFNSRNENPYYMIVCYAHKRLANKVQEINDEQHTVKLKRNTLEIEDAIEALRIAYALFNCLQESEKPLFIHHYIKLNKIIEKAIVSIGRESIEPLSFD